MHIQKIKFLATENSVVKTLKSIAKILVTNLVIAKYPSLKMVSLNFSDELCDGEKSTMESTMGDRTRR